MNISITGASGDIGSAFLAHAVTHSSIKALVRQSTSIQVPEQALIEYFRFSDGYIYDTSFLRLFMDSESIVHFAARLNTSTADTDIVEYFATNAFLTGLLATNCLYQDTLPKFVYISSEMVYTLPAGKELADFTAAFLTLCKESFLVHSRSHNLRTLASTFIKENEDFPYEQFNLYALTKYLGEAITRSIPKAAVLRVTNVYGPKCTKSQIIPRLIIARLTGHGTTYPKEKRDFVYSADINKLIDVVIANNLTGIIDCKSSEVTDTKDLRDTIIHFTPTAYGTLTGVAVPTKPHPLTYVEAAPIDLKSIIGNPVPFADGLLTTMHYHKEQCYHDMANTRTMEDFLEQGERIVEELRGSSAAYLYVVVDKDGILKVRKVAIRDGVEGNGIAKVSNEIRYYKHIAKHEPELAKMYPQLLDAQTDPTFSSETIEYLEGKNYYAALRGGELPFSIYNDSFQRFIDSLCTCVLEKLATTKDPENGLDAYYIERSLSRLQPIHDHVDVQDTISINGKKLLAPHIILTDLLSNKQLRHFIMPHIECFCFHGDLTLLNTVFLRRTHEIRLIDPRGHTGMWDPLYDFAKLKFSLSGFGEFILGSELIVTKTGEGYSIDFNYIPTLVQTLHKTFFTVLTSSQEFNSKIISQEPYWCYRILLAEATHYLADIPFRLFTDETTWTAIASYVVGTYYLNQVYEELLTLSTSKLNVWCEIAKP